MSEEAEILASASRRVGMILHGKYHIDSVLGVGGMATVYAATHRNRKRFAVKMLHTELSVRSDVRARFVREGYLANSVPHPGVVAVLDDDVDETGSAFLVMELLEGVTVDALSTRGGPIPVPVALGIAYQLLDVLEAAHQKSVIHRDIKPANLLVLRDGQLKVLDFGIAQLRDPDLGLKSTHNGVVLGTPAFMAPEQALGMPENVDVRTDVWAAGATLFTMLSACFVHRGENARQIMIRAATDPARSIQSIMPEVPAAVAAIVSRALAFERAQRWPSAGAMRDALLQASIELFGSAPVRADVALHVERTSAALGAQPTELLSFTDFKRAARPSSEPPVVTPDVIPDTPARPRRILETTMATPVAEAAQAAPGVRWRPVAVLSATAVTAIAALLTPASPAARKGSPSPAARQGMAEVQRAAPAASSGSARAPAAIVLAAREETLTPAPATSSIARPIRSAANSRKAPLRPQGSAAVTQPAAPPLRPEDPLTLKLQ
jgi:eukaryotic-like serine/threonine-protein kinase